MVIDDYNLLASVEKEIILGLKVKIVQNIFFSNFLQFSAFPRFLQVLSNDIFGAWFSSCVGHFYIPYCICNIYHLANINHTIGFVTFNTFFRGSQECVFLFYEDPVIAYTKTLLIRINLKFAKIFVIIKINIRNCLLEEASNSIKKEESSKK